MDSVSGEIIDAFFADTEVEDLETICKPKDIFEKQLFEEENHETVIEEEENQRQSFRENEENIVDDIYYAEDFDDIEHLPLDIRLHSSIGCRVDGRIAYISQSKNVLWDTKPNKQDKTKRKNIFPEHQCRVTGDAQKAQTPLDAWKLFITDEMIETITVNTNIWIENNKHNYSRERDCPPTSPAEIKAVMGLLYLAGVMKVSHENLRDLYSSDGLGVDFFTLVMSEKRLRFLLVAMCFDDLSTRDEREELDKMAAIRDVFEIFVENCQRNYEVSGFVTVDEILEPFRGQCGFRVYMKNKAARYGIKIVNLTCAQTFYTSNLEVFLGNQPEGPFDISNSPHDTVLRSIQPISESGRNVTIGNNFTSFPLCVDLLKNHQLTMVGSVSKDKGEIPSFFLETNGKTVGSSVFGFKQDCTLVSYQSNIDENVIVLSSLHLYDVNDDLSSHKCLGEPDIVSFFNSSRGAVKTFEKYKETYSVSRITNRWPMKLFYTILDYAGINSFIVLKANLNEPSMIRKNFLRSLAKELCKEFMSARSQLKTTPRLTKKKTCQLLGLTEERYRPPPEDVTSGRCYSCDWKKNRSTKTRCAKCRHFICREHTAPYQCVNCVQFGEEDIYGWLTMVMKNQQRRHPPPEDAVGGRCYLCSHKKNRKTKKRCGECRHFICMEHMAPCFCTNCGQQGGGGVDSEMIVPTAVEAETAEVRRKIRERCLLEPDLRPIDVLQETMVTCTPEVRAFLTRQLDIIRKDIQECASRVGGVATAVRKRKLKTSDSGFIQRKKQSITQNTAGETLSSTSKSCHTFDYLNTAEHARDKNSDTPMKVESVKTELLIEDFHNLDDSMGESCFYESETKENFTEDNTEDIPQFEDAPPSFESVVCGYNFQVKQEISDDTDTDEMEQEPLVTTSSTLEKNICTGENSESTASESRLKSMLDSSNLPIQDNIKVNLPGSETSLLSTADYENFKDVISSLKKIPLERREKTKEKVLRLVKLITELGVDPDEISFSITTK